MQNGSADDRWEALVRTAAAIRAPAVSDVEDDAISWRRLLRRGARGGMLLAAAAVLVIPPTANPLMAHADAGGDATLLTLTNQDRASNGVPALKGNATLRGIGESTPYHICGITVAGRSQDMITRNYFSHYIPPCGQLVFVIMQAAGVKYKSAGENIGWTGGYTDVNSAAAYVNTSFMNSPDHRANILNRNYTDLGIGSAFAPTWTGNGGSISNTWMFSEEFAQLTAAPPATPRPTAKPPVKPPVKPPTHNSPAPPSPQVPPVQTVVPTAPPTATASAQPTPSFNPFANDPTLTGGVAPPLIWQQGGLLSDSVEGVLESYLVG